MFPHRLRLPIANTAALTPADAMASVGRDVSAKDSPAERDRELHHGFQKQRPLSWRIVEAPRDLEGLAGDWRGLLQDEASPFQTFSWIRAWYRNYADGADASFAFVVSAGGETVAIFPCYRMGKQIRLAGDGVCDYQDLIVSRETPDSVVEDSLRLLVAWVKRQRRGCHLFFEKLSSRGRLFPMVQRMRSGQEGLFLHQEPYGPCPWMPLEDSLEAWLGSLPRKFRGDMRRALNRLDREVPDARVEMSGRNGVSPDQVRRAVRYHCENFRKDGTSPLADERLVGMLEEVASEEEVGLRIASLRTERAVLAVDLGFSRGSTYYGYLTAFDQDYARLAPGKCLLLKRIDPWVADEGIQTLDFLCGGERYKEGFTNGRNYQVVSASMLPRRWGTFLHYAGLKLNRMIRGGAKNLARRLGCEPASIRRVLPRKRDSNTPERPVSVGANARKERDEEKVPKP